MSTDYHLEYEGERPIVSATRQEMEQLLRSSMLKSANAPVLIKVVSEDGKARKSITTFLYPKSTYRLSHSLKEVVKNLIHTKPELVN